MSVRIVSTSTLSNASEKSIELSDMIDVLTQANHWVPCKCISFSLYADVRVAIIYDMYTEIVGDKFEIVWDMCTEIVSDKLYWLM